MKELIFIQSSLKAPKGQFNKFGNYSYRSCEDIVEAVKPLLAETETALVIHDDIKIFGESKVVQTFSDFGYSPDGKNWTPDVRQCEILIGSRMFVCATATLFRKDGSKIAQAQGFAELPTERKGMDAAQVTGASSSYARKYALNALFAIDDTKDADDLNTHGNGSPVPGGRMPGGRAPRPAAAPKNDGGFSQKETAAPRPAPVPAAAPAPRPTMLDLFLQKGVNKEQIEEFFQVRWEEFTDTEKGVVRDILKIMNAGKSFEDACAEVKL